MIKLDVLEDATKIEKKNNTNEEITRCRSLLNSIIRGLKNCLFIYRTTKVVVV